MKMKKIGLSIISVLLLVVIAFISAGAANEITTQAEYISNFSNPSLEGGIYYIKGTWEIPSLHNNTDKLTLNDNIVIDFTNFTGTFKGIQIADKEDNRGALFGNVSLGGHTLTINGLNLTSTTVLSSGSNIGGIIGSASSGTLNMTNCLLENCTIEGKEFIGGLIGYADPAVMNIENCSSLHCSIKGGTRVGGGAGFAAFANCKNCTIENSTGTGGYYVGGLIGQAFSVSFEDCNVTNTSLYGSYADVGCLIGLVHSYYGSTAVKRCANCHAESCVIAGGTNAGGLIGIAYADTGTALNGMVNCHVMNSAVTGGNKVGGLIGDMFSESGTVVSNCDGNIVMNSAIRGNGDSVHLDCGSRSGQVGCTNPIGYLNTGNISLAEPLISVYSHIFDYPISIPSSPYIIITNLTNIGTLNNPKKALGYVVDKTILTFNPCNGSSETYSGDVLIGNTTISFTTPVYMGYNFSGWIVIDASGTMLTDATGTLQANVMGYTNATGYWNYNGLDTVSLYANWTGHEYNNSVSDNNVTYPPNLAINSINLNPNSDVVAIAFKYEAPEGNPQRGGATVTTVSDPFTLNATGSLNGTKAIINFNVTTVQIGSYNPENIRLAHYVGSAWTFIKPTYNGLIGINHTFSAEVDSLSPFAVVSYVENPPTYSSSSSRQTGYTVILPETIAPTVTPTSTPTQIPTPTVAPLNLTTQPTQKSPAPFLGLIAGLGAAVLLRLRR